MKKLLFLLILTFFLISCGKEADGFFMYEVVIGSPHPDPVTIHYLIPNKGEFMEIIYSHETDYWSFREVYTEGDELRIRAEGNAILNVNIYVNNELVNNGNINETVTYN